VAPADVARLLVTCAALSSPPPRRVLKGLGSALRRQLDSFRPAELSQVRLNPFLILLNAFLILLRTCCCS
jgi:hypothetical protein